MKTIAVLTNFSDRANNAASYALKLAQQLHANIILYHSYLMPSTGSFASQVAWPIENFDEIKEDSETQLSLLADKFIKEVELLPADTFHPTIKYESKTGNLSAHLSGSLADKNVFLLVLSTHQNGFANLLQDNNMQQIIENVSLPVLIIPEHQIFKKINKIAFATDLNHSDIEILGALAEFARPFQAEIMLSHISTDPSALDAKIAGDYFLKEVTNKVNYPHIYYRHIQNDHIKKGLEWLTDHVAYDLLVMVHRNKGFFAQLFNTSNTEKMADEAKLPLLIYNCPA